MLTSSPLLEGGYLMPGSLGPERVERSSRSHELTRPDGGLGMYRSHNKNQNLGR